MSNYKVVLGYDGTSFFGFQNQPKKRTVESVFIDAVRLFYTHLEYAYAGRTDSGVHADGQVFHLKGDTQLNPDTLVRALRTKLPKDIWINSIEPVEETFHARYSAKEREYHYYFTDQQLPYYLQNRVVSIRFEPKLTGIEDVTNHIIGTHDFKSLRNLGSDEKNTKRTIYQCEIERINTPLLYEKTVTLYRLKIVANSFLYRMVRHIMGAIFEVLKGKRSPNDFKVLLESGKSCYSYTVAPAHGLCLVHVKY